MIVTITSMAFKTRILKAANPRKKLVMFLKYYHKSRTESDKVLLTLVGFAANQLTDDPYKENFNLYTALLDTYVVQFVYL